MLILLANLALAQQPPPPAKPAQTTAGDDVEGGRLVLESTIISVRNLGPRYDFRPRESFVPRVIDAVERKPF